MSRLLFRQHLATSKMRPVPHELQLPSRWLSLEAAVETILWTISPTRSTKCESMPMLLLVPERLAGEHRRAVDVGEEADPPLRRSMCLTPTLTLRSLTQSSTKRISSRRQLLAHL